MTPGTPATSNAAADATKSARGNTRRGGGEGTLRSLVFRSRLREENPKWTTLREFGFTPFYCEPGLRGAHEKGWVEVQVGYFRRNYLTPVPRVVTLEDLNQRITAFEERELSRRVGSQIRTIGQDFARETPHLLPLPPEAFETAMTFEPRVDRYSRITVKVCSYSVPVRFIDRKVTVHLTGDTLVVFEGRREIARHARLADRGLEHLVLDHYLEVLLRKPGALERSEALHQARAGGTFTAEHEAFWAMAKHQHLP